MQKDTVYIRTCRPSVDGNYSSGARAEYIEDRRYCKTSPSLYIRAFLLIQKDLQELFEFIEPHDDNLDCFSLRMHELIVRSCIEIEQNFRGIMAENIYSKPGFWNTSDYIKINKTHFLSDFEIEILTWHGKPKILKPFDGWNDKNPTQSLAWYSSYNSSKHDRYSDFKNANLENALNAICGLLVVLSAQFCTNSFQPGSSFLATNNGKEYGIGDYFGIKFPQIPSEERYDINEYQKDRCFSFKQIDYDKIS